ncbi:hypothetical protein B7P43_G01929 [Cryptotermes secundus]|uniref:Uncharacterized protein n=1 Tax=Cryptotermes secundus TaxID=105785 RepID=A0A2J7QLU6_9NEOP|nr:hypothetical protein B7P43_G01929 [Cryptotermes secundus]
MAMGISCADHMTTSVFEVGTNLADKRRSLGLSFQDSMVRIFCAAAVTQMSLEFLADCFMAVAGS